MLYCAAFAQNASYKQRHLFILYLLITMPHKPTYMGDAPQKNNVFIGRITEIKAIKDLLTQPEPLLLRGMGGMGKTTLVNELCAQIGKQYDYVIYTNCKNSDPDAKNPLQDYLLYDHTLLHHDLQINDRLRAERDEKQKWAILLSRIKALNGTILWIIDNAYQKDTATIKKLLPNCQIILTSREPIGDIHAYNVDELGMLDALHLFKHYYKRPDDDQQILDVCRCIGYHALSIELLAKTLQALPDKDTSFLLAQLNLQGINIPQQQPVWTDYAQKEIHLNQCLLVAFSMGKLYEQTDIHPLFRFFCLMPYQYIPYNLIEQITETQGNAAKKLLLSQLRQLTDLGWIKQARTEWDNTTQESWQMHPMIQDIITQKLGKDAKQEEVICWQINNKAVADYKQNEIKAQLWRPFLERLVKYVTAQNEAIAAIYTVLALLNRAMGNYAIALQQQKTALQIAEQMLPAQHPDLATLYLNMGAAYQSLTDYATALNYYEKCRSIREQILPPLHPDLASLYLNMGIAYDSLTDYATALNYYEKCRSIREQILSPLHPDLASLYLNMGSTYQHLTNYATALSYYEKCRSIREKILPALHPDLANLYLNMGVTYNSLTDYATALSYYEKCRTIREQILPPLHPDLAMLYLNIGNTYQSLTDYATALNYYEKCRSIYEQILPPQHPNLAGLYLNMGVTYQSSTDYATALNYYEKCRTIFEQILPPQHPNLAALYLNMGNTYHNLADYATALNYYEKCRSIREQILSPQHPDLAMLYLNIAILYARQAQWQEAQVYANKGVDIFKAILPTNHPYLQKALKLQQYIQANL
jgi:tetratricopeptide (TPR) repeat protein